MKKLFFYFNFIIIRKNIFMEQMCRVTQPQYKLKQHQECVAAKESEVMDNP